MKKILLDTNFLLIPAQFNIDIFTEIGKIADFNYQIFILDKSIDELKKIAEEQTGRLKREVKLTLSIIKDKIKKGEINILKIDNKDNVDDIIVSLDDYIIGTQDLALQKRLKTKKAKIISMRQKKYLFFKE